MKKMMMVLMMVFGLSAVFAYEPKKENVTVNGDVEYYEQTEVWNICGWNPEMSTANRKLNQDAELVLTLALEMFPIQLPMTEKAYNDLQTIEAADPKTAADDWFYRNKEENKWLDVADPTSEKS